MRPVTSRSTRAGRLSVLLVIFAVLAGCQPQSEDSQDIGEDRKAAERGHADAQCELGLMYKTGKGVPENYKEAVKWLRLAAEQGEPRAQYTLGEMYRWGEGVPKDYVRAYAWTILAGTQEGFPPKVVSVTKEQLRPSMTAAQVAEAQKLAGEIYRRIESSKSE